MVKLKSSDLVAVTSRSFSQNEVLVNELRNHFSQVKLNETGETLKGESLRVFLDNADKAIIGIEEINKDLLSQLPKLKMISKYGVGLNNIDIEACKELGVEIAFTPGANKSSVAEFALLLILNALRRIDSNKDEIINNHWSQQKGRGLLGKRIGILGMGNIGKELIKLLAPFDTEIFFYDQLAQTVEVNKSIKISQVTLEELLTNSEIISIHLPLTPETKNIISSEVLEKMKKDVILINTARGDVVDEMALADALLRRVIAGAGLDVYEKEPEVPDSLLALDQVVLLPHMGSGTVETREAMGFRAVSNIEAFAEGRALPDRGAIS